MGMLMKRAAGITGALILLIALAPWAMEYVPAVFGMRCYGVHGGSMEPALRDGDLVYASTVDPDALGPGDIAVFLDWTGEGSYVVHRVVTNDAGRGMIVTKGDANEDPDALPVPYQGVTGKMVLRLPGFDHIMDALTSGAGGCATLFAAGSGAMLLVMSLSMPGRKRYKNYEE